MPYINLNARFKRHDKFLVGSNPSFIKIIFADLLFLHMKGEWHATAMKCASARWHVWK